MLPRQAISIVKQTSESTKSTTTTTQRDATGGDDLSSMLSEYAKSSASTSSPKVATSSKAAAAASPKVAASSEPLTQSTSSSVETTTAATPVVVESPPPTPVFPEPAAVITSTPPVVPEVVATPEPLPKVLPEKVEKVLANIPASPSMKPASTMTEYASTTPNYRQNAEALREQYLRSRPQIHESIVPQSSAATTSASTIKSASTASDPAPTLPEFLADRLQVVASKTQQVTAANWQSTKASTSKSIHSMQDYWAAKGPEISQNVQQSVKESVAKMQHIDTQGLDAWKKQTIQAPSVDGSETAARMQQYFSTEVPHAVASVGLSWNAFVASWGDLSTTVEEAATRGGKMTPEELAVALNLKETGGWYLTAGGVFLLLVGAAMNDGGSGASMSSSSVATTATADMSAMEATKAEEARQQEEEQAAQLLVDEQMATLQEATAAVYKQLEEMKAEKSERAYEVATMKSELRSVMNKLDLTSSQEQSLRASLDETQKKFKTETDLLRAQLEERVAAEQELRAQLEETKCRLDAETKNVEKAKADATKKVKAAKDEVTKLKGEKTEMEQEMETLREQVAALQKQLGGEGVVDLDVDVAAPPTATKKKGSKAKTSTKATSLPNTESYNELSDAFSEAISEASDAAKTKKSSGPRSPKRKAKSSTAAAKKTKKVSVKKKSAPVKRNGVSKDEPDWSGLSAATLKRKTIKELTSYLELKGASTTDSDGNKLKKQDLVERVLSP